MNALSDQLSCLQNSDGHNAGQEPRAPGRYSGSPFGFSLCASSCLFVAISCFLQAPKLSAISSCQPSAISSQPPIVAAETRSES